MTAGPASVSAARPDAMRTPLTRSSIPLPTSAATPRARRAVQAKKDDAECVLVRARTDNRKISVRVLKADAAHFQLRLTAIMRGSCSNLVKRSKKAQRRSAAQDA